jgi:glycogen synthase
MRICLVSLEYPPEPGWGGIGKYTYNLAHGLEKIGQEVTVISSTKRNNEHYLDGNISVYRLSMSPPRIRGLKYFPFAAYRKAVDLIRKNNLSVIEAPLTFGDGLAFSFAKIRPLVISLHTPSFVLSEIYNMSRFASARWEMLEKTTLIRASRILSNTSINGSLITKHYKIKEDKIRVVPHGIDVSKYKVNAFPSIYQKKSTDEKVVLFVGRLEKRKGVDVLLKAIPQILKEYPTVTFVLVGSDTPTSPIGSSYKGYILKKSESNGYGKHIQIVDFISEEDLIAYYYNCDIFVAPSRYESFGLVFLEAMACSKPAVGTRIGGIPEVIEDGKTGILVPLGDSIALKNVLVDLLTNDKKRVQLGANARLRVERDFTDIAMANKTLRVFEEVA